MYKQNKSLGYTTRRHAKEADKLQNTMNEQLDRSESHVNAGDCGLALTLYADAQFTAGMLSAHLESEAGNRQLVLGLQSFKLHRKIANCFRKSK